MECVCIWRFQFAIICGFTRACPPSSICRAYDDIGLTISNDINGFIQSHPAGGSAGLEIHVATDKGSWLYRREGLICPKGANGAIQSRHRWPNCKETNTPPNVGEVIVLIGGRPAFLPSPIPNDGYADDAIGVHLRRFSGTPIPNN